MEASVVGKKRNNVVVLGNSISRKKRCIKRTKQCKKPTMSMTLQKLFTSCKQVFKGPGTIPNSLEVQNLRHILDNMNPEDLGLSTDLLFFKSGGVTAGTPSITYTTICKTQNFSMCLFFLPPSAVIPLHNHPGMTVFSKLLLGSMHIKSYDWVDSDMATSSQLRLAKLKADNVFTAPCNTSVLYPTSGGNIHAFTALTPCALLDVIGPPYSKEDGRDCSYYRDFPCSVSIDSAVDVALERRNWWNMSSKPCCPMDEALEALEGKDVYGLLEEIEMPKDLKMEGIEYLGPQIIHEAAV
ncbi:plant cysteine oxidase 2-like isoform X1 [Papaver somniferum]|uniref:plant cysteine oxidase 2-like isoform X1 n=1 Tax=Papaver somniferum TaxID=3469 RepID=UPI000E6F7799|nr:plant cysteine oxidase 2-like isoform X1 [Papaver somniferum]